MAAKNDRKTTSRSMVQPEPPRAEDRSADAGDHLREMENRALSMAAGGAPLHEILDVIARAIDTACRGTMTSSILLADDDGLRLRHGAAPGLPAQYNEAIDGIPIRDGAGSCGTAAYRKQRIVASDIAHDSRWTDYRELAREHGLGACWSTPIVGTSGEVLGTFALYYRDPREPSEEDLQLIERAAHAAKIAIERHRDDRERAGLLARADEERKRAEDAREEMALIHRLSTAVSRADSLEHVYDAALETIQHALQVERASVLLLDSERVMRFTAWRGLSDEYRRAVDGHSPWTPDETAPTAILLDDVEADPQMSAYLPVFRREGIRAIGFVPLVYGDRLLGKFMLYDGQPRSFGARERQVAGTIADHVAWAVGRLRGEQAVREADRRKDEFLAMLGHELRNPLAPILTALELLRLRGYDGEARELQIIERQVAHLIRLIDDLLDVSRITQGKVELRLEHIEIADVVARALEMARPLLEQRRHALELNVPASGAAVFGDRARLAQVVSNLLTNAAKYTAPGGRIRVHAALVEGAVVLVVRDTGIGIAPETLPRVFDLFTQERQALDRAQGGLGLGLAIVKRIVELHGGSVDAASEGPGRGSEFSIRLPLAVSRSDTVSADDIARPRASGEGVRVLVVDDNEDAAATLCMALSSHGYEARSAHDAPSALRVAEQLAPDVAILDIGLPVMNGYELAARFRAHPALAHVRLIALTGYGQEQDRTRAAHAGFAAHLVKPVNLDELRSVLAARS